MILEEDEHFFRSSGSSIIVDIDGTVSNHNGLRGHYEYDKVLSDEPVWPIINLVSTFVIDGYCIRFVTGRMDNGNVRKDTITWLYDHMPFLHGNSVFLYMRADGDYRPDDVVKKEIYHAKIEPNSIVYYVLDDRDRVVKMWRSLGLTCLQVANGDF